MLSTLLLAVLVGSQRIQENSKLLVTSPKSLQAEFKDGEVPGTPAMFGAFVFGHSQSITGRLYYADFSDDEFACHEFSEEDIKQMPFKQGQPLIIMVDRGNCTFVTKVRDVQKAGGVAAIIVDNQFEYGGRLPYMANDNTGANIAIQSLLINLKDGDRLKKTLKDEEVYVKLSWNLPHPDGRVEYDLWTTSGTDSDAAMTFKKDFAPVAKALGDKALFTPHYEFVDGSVRRCTYPVGSCGNQCTNQGRYCMFDPERDLDIGFNGSQIVRENVRQICLYKFLNETQEYDAWWDYVNSFEGECGTVEKFNQKCSLALMEKVAKGSSEAVVSCIDKSGGYKDEGGKNTIIEDELQLQMDMNIFSFPTLLINNRPYRASLSCTTKDSDKRFDRTRCGVLEAICTGYADNTKPLACQSPARCPIGQMPDDCYRCGGTCFNCAEDECGVCQAKNSTNWNKSCLGCDGVPRSGLKNDSCDVCNGPGKDACGNCPTADRPRVNNATLCEEVSAGGGGTIINNSFPTWGVVLIVLGCVGLVGGGVFVYMRRREDAMRQDIDSLLKQYLPMGDQPIN